MVTPTVTPPAPAANAAAAAEGMGGLNAASLGISLGMQVGNFISAYGQSEVASFMQEKQLQIALANFAHQDKLTEIGKNGDLVGLKMREDTLNKIAGKAKEYNTANEDLVKAQCSLTEVKYQIVEKKKTEAMAKVNTAQIDKYFYGKPAKAA